MSDTSETMKLVTLFANKKRNSTLDYEQFLAFVKDYAEKHREEHPELDFLCENTSTVLISELEGLVSSGKIRLEQGGDAPAKILYPDFFLQAIGSEYSRIRDNPETPFPSEESMGLKAIPDDLLSSVNVKNDFTTLLKKDDTEDQANILRLVFPEGFKSVVVTRDLVNVQLLEMAVGKIKVYLGTRRNSNYMLNRLSGMFGPKEMMVKETLEGIMRKPGQSVNQIRQPTDFSFRFWTTLANVIIQEFKQKTNKLAGELSICQACYLIGFYAVHFKGLVQHEKNTHAALQVLDKQLKRAPYYFAVSDIYNFKDAKGVLLTKKYSRDQLHQHLSEKTKPEGDSPIPEVFRLETPGDKQYFIHREVLLPLCVKKIFDASSEYRNIYVERWEEQLRELESSDAMTDDQRFLRDLEEQVKSEDPLLFALLNFELLYLTMEEVKITQNVEFQVKRLFDVNRKGLIPLDEILKLDRAELLADAKRRLPIWQVMPVIGPLLVFFKRMMKGSGKGRKKKMAAAAGTGKKGKTAAARSYKPRSGFKKVSKETPPPQTESTAKPGAPSSAQTAKAKMVEFRKKIASLTEEFTGKGRTVDQSLKELIDKWNPLFDEKARKNLIEDVNSMIRDFVRGLRKGILIRPPDAQGIRTMAERLSGNKAFSEIKRKTEFQQYIEIYMLKILGRE